jgi:hypothetical protein
MDLCLQLQHCSQCHCIGIDSISNSIKCSTYNHCHYFCHCNLHTCVARVRRYMASRWHPLHIRVVYIICSCVISCSGLVLCVAHQRKTSAHSQSVDHIIPGLYKWEATLLVMDVLMDDSRRLVCGETRLGGSSTRWYVRWTQ